MLWLKSVDDQDCVEAKLNMIKTLWLIWDSTNQIICLHFTELQLMSLTFVLSIKSIKSLV